MKRKKRPAGRPSRQAKLASSQVYGEILNALDLSPDHIQSLTARGLTDAEAKTLGYRSYPMKRRELLSVLTKKYTPEELLASETPGLYLGESGELEISGCSGIAIPIRDIDGTIVNIKIRADKPRSPALRYLLLSSNPKPDKKTGHVKYISGTAATARIHFPLGRPDKIETLRITEGELKADIAFALTDIYTLSLPGVSVWRQAIDAIRLLQPRKVLLAFDTDKDKPTHPGYQPGDGVPKDEAPPPAVQEEQFLVGKAVSALYLSLKEERTALGIESVQIETWPAEAGKGIDDVLANGASDQITILSEEESDKFAQDMLAKDMPKGWVYVVGVKRFYHTETLLELDKEQYADRYLHMEDGNPASNALRNSALPKVDLPIYLPDKPMLFEQDGKRYFNTWRSGTLQPVPGDIGRFLEHCEYILPSAKEREILMDWLAFNIQNRGTKILWAILLKGEPGTGKSYFGTLMRWMLGEQNVSCPTNEMIHEIYTSWIKSCQLVVIEEIMARGRLELMNKLKPMITQPTAIVREMHKPAYEQPNVFNLLMFTNHSDALLIDREDRRYCVLFSPARPREHEYYASLWDWTRENKGKILHWFLQRDLSSFQPLAHAPMTKGKAELISESMTDVQAWVVDGVEEESWPFMGDLVGTNHLLSCAPRNLKNLNRQTLSRALKTAGARQIKSPVPLAGGGQIRLWSLRRHEIWAGAERETLAAEYLRWSSEREPGGNPLYEARPM